MAESMREQMLEELVRQHVSIVEAAATWTFARHGGAAQFVKAGAPLETIIFPPHVDPADAIANCGQPAGWKQGVILVRTITHCDKSTVITTDIESVKAAAAEGPGSHV